MSLPTDPKWFRQVLGQYPTGVCVVTAQPEGEARPVGLAVGSFTSVSLEPPLVAFLPDRKSSTWPKINACGRFCVSILAADQEPVCRQFASKLPDKFDGILYRASPGGAPIIEGCVAWIDCELHSVEEAGDHFIVIGRVAELHLESGGLPLLFFQGGYGQFLPLSLAAPDPLGLIAEPLRYAELARPEMERVAAELGARCIATARTDDEIVVAASAGTARPGSLPTLVGQRFPFVPATGSIFAAWTGEAQIDGWLKRSRPEARQPCLDSLLAVRRRGYSVGLLSEAQRTFASVITRLAESSPHAPDRDLRELVERLDYDPDSLTPEVAKRIRLISAPIFGPGGDVVLALSVYEFPRPDPANGIGSYINCILEVADNVTRKLGGEPPPRVALDSALERSAS